MKIKRRIRALEARMGADSILLVFPDGTARELHGPRHFIPRLFMAVLQRKASPRQAELLDLIRQSVGSQESGGGYMVDMVRIALAAVESGPPIGESEWDRCEGLPEATG